MLLALLPALALAQAPTITIRAGTVLDGRGGILHNTTIVIAGSRIARLDPALTAATYDLSRLTVMPGGIDTHVHLTSHFDANGRAHNDPGGAEPLDQTVLYTEENAYRALMAGITTVQSIGSTLDRDLRDAIARGTVPGPRVITSLDWITPADGDADGLPRTVQQRVAAAAEVIQILGSKSIREGGGPTLSEDELRAACGEAKAHGRRCVVHAHAAEAARRAVLAGATSIEHGVLLDEATLDLMADHGTFFDPNLYLVFQNYFDNKARFLGMENLHRGGIRADAPGGPPRPHGVPAGAATPQAPHRVRHRRRRGCLREELGGADLSSAGRRPAADGRNRVRDVARGSVARVGGHDRCHSPRARGRLDRHRRQPGRRHHRAAARRVRDEGRRGSEERRAGPVGASLQRSTLTHSRTGARSAA